MWLVTHTALRKMHTLDQTYPVKSPTVRISSASRSGILTRNSSSSSMNSSTRSRPMSPSAIKAFPGPFSLGAKGLSRPPPAGRNGLPRNEAGILGQEEAHHRGDFLRPGHPPHRGDGDQLVHQSGVG